MVLKWTDISDISLCNEFKRNSDAGLQVTYFIFKIDWALIQVSDREAFACERFSTFTDSLVGTCMKANDSVIIGLRELPMLPNELSYKPNHDYYFISKLF